MFKVPTCEVKIKGIHACPTESKARANLITSLHKFQFIRNEYNR